MTPPTYHFGIEQGTDEWHAVRAGKWSASCAAIIMGGLTTSGLTNLIKDIAWERVFGPHGEERFSGKAMQRGHEVEPEARDSFAFERNVQVVECGFVQHATVEHVGWSPDGLHARAEDGTRWRRGIEAKSPLHRAFMEVLRAGQVPSEYRWQCRWACWVGQLDAIDFCAYHPAFGLRVIEATVTDAECDQMAARVSLLEKQVAEWVDILTNAREAA